MLNLVPGLGIAFFAEKMLGLAIELVDLAIDIVKIAIAQANRFHGFLFFIGKIKLLDFQFDLVPLFNRQARILDRQQGAQLFPGIAILFGGSNFLGFLLQFGRPGFKILQLNPLDFIKNESDLGKHIRRRDVIPENPPASFKVLRHFAALLASEIDLCSGKLILGTLHQLGDLDLLGDPFFLGQGVCSGFPFTGRLSRKGVGIGNPGLGLGVAGQIRDILGKLVFSRKVVVCNRRHAEANHQQHGA